MIDSKRQHTKRQQLKIFLIPSRAIELSLHHVLFPRLGHACSSPPVDSTHLDKDSPLPQTIRRYIRRAFRTRAYAAKAPLNESVPRWRLEKLRLLKKERERERELCLPRDKSKRRCSGGTWILRNYHLVDSLLCFTWNVVKWRLTIKWTPRRGCVTRLKYRLSPRGTGGEGFDGPISTGSTTIRAISLLYKYRY